MRIYGGYVSVPFMEDEQAKKLLREQLHQTIDELCDMDDFWIPGFWIPGGPENTIGWKIAIPHMKGDSDGE